jgi:hypothetical protein
MIRIRPMLILGILIDPPQITKIRMTNYELPHTLMAAGNPQFIRMNKKIVAVPAKGLIRHS